MVQCNNLDYSICQQGKYVWCQATLVRKPWRIVIIALIDRKKNFNDITTLLVTKIKGYLEIEYELNIKQEIIEQIKLEIKYNILEVSTFNIINSNRKYITLKKK